MMSMTPSGLLHIGPLAMTCEAAPGMPKPVETGPYASFFHDESSSEPAETPLYTLPITCSRECIELPSGTPDFESGRNWKLYRAGHDLLFAAGYTGRPRPERVCRVNTDLTQCRIAVDPEIRNREPVPGPMAFPPAYPIDQILVWGMLSRIRGALLHAALVVRKNGDGLLLAGRSGAGKSTLSALCADAGWTVLNDDRAIVHFEGGNVMASGTPWHGSGQYAVRRTVPLAGILFLVQAEENRLEALDRASLLPELLRVTSLPLFLDEWATPVFAALNTLAQSVPMQRFHFVRDPSAVERLASERM